MSDPNRPAGAWKLIASVVAVVSAIGGLLYASTKSGAEYYKHVDEVMSNVDSFRSKRLQVHGHVVDGSIEQARGTLHYRFKIETRPPRAPAVIAAEYKGIVPDNFKSGAEVVAKGTLTADNRLNVSADGIMAKCPSKYEAAAPTLGPTGAAVPAVPANLLPSGPVAPVANQ